MSIEPIRTRNCPICGRKTDLHYRPFCSRRCADVDLGRWLSGAYAIPAEEHDGEDGGKVTPSESED
ncbi:MAG: DNA gyrase inhibitor YacG [bacterium]